MVLKNLNKPIVNSKSKQTNSNVLNQIKYFFSTNTGKLTGAILVLLFILSLVLGVYNQIVQKKGNANAGLICANGFVPNAYGTACISAADFFFIPATSLTISPNPSTGLSVFGDKDYTLVLKDDRIVANGSSAYCTLRIKELTSPTDNNPDRGYDKLTSTMISPFNNGGTVITDAGVKVFKVDYSTTGSNLGTSIKILKTNQKYSDYDLEVRCIRNSDNQIFARDERVNFLFGAYAAVSIGGVVVNSSNFTVTNTNPSGPGSLSQAILDSNSTNSPTLQNKIIFNIPGSGPFTITHPNSGLPLDSNIYNITKPVLIDATTQPGFVSTPIIKIVGTAQGKTPDPYRAEAFKISSSYTTIKGLAIGKFSSAIKVNVSAIQAFSNINIENNYIGVDFDGVTAIVNSSDPLLVSNNVGIEFFDTNVYASPTTVTDSIINNNVVSSNGIAIAIYGGNIGVVNNKIGTDKTGNVSMNNIKGVIVKDGPGLNFIIDNVISGNRDKGIILYDTKNLQVINNKIGMKIENVVQLCNNLGDDRSSAISGAQIGLESSILPANSNITISGNSFCGSISNAFNFNNTNSLEAGMTIVNNTYFDKSPGLLPKAKIIQPFNEQTFLAGSAIAIAGLYGESNGAIVSEFFVDDISLGTTTWVNGVITNKWTNATLGSHVIKLKVKDSFGLIGESSIVVNITNTTPVNTIYTTPSCIIFSPVDNKIYPAESVINVSIKAIDITNNIFQQDNIQKVEFYLDNTLVNTTSKALNLLNYNYTFLNLTPGNHSIYSKVYDNQENTCTTDTINIIKS